MIVVKVLVAATVATLLSFGLLIAALTAFAVNTFLSTGVSDIGPSEQALADIPPLMLEGYMQAVLNCPGLPWTILAGIGKVESNHGRYGGSTIGV